MPVIEQKTTNKNKVDFDLNRLDKSKTTIFSKYPKFVGGALFVRTQLEENSSYSEYVGQPQNTVFCRGQGKGHHSTV